MHTRMQRTTTGVVDLLAVRKIRLAGGMEVAAVVDANCHVLFAGAAREEPISNCLR